MEDREDIFSIDSDADQEISPTRSLRLRQILFTSAVVVISSIVFASIAFVGTRDAIGQAVGVQLAHVARETSRGLHDLLRNESARLESWARLDLMSAILVGDDDGHITRFLAALIDSPAYVAIVGRDAAGTVVAASSTEVMGQVFPTDAFGPTAQLDRVSVRGPMFSDRWERAVLELSIALPHPTDADRVIGDLRLFYDWDHALEIAREARRGLGELGSVADLLVLGADKQVLGGAWSDSTLPHTVSETWEAKIPKRFGIVTHPGDESLLLAGAATLAYGTLRWSVIAVQPLETALRPVFVIALWWVLVLVVVLTLAVGVSVVMARRMIGPLQDLQSAAGALSAEPHRLPAPIPVHTRDEIGRLASTFNRMAQRLAEAREQLSNASKFAFAGEVAAGIAHEIRTPIGVMRTSAQMLRREMSTDDAENVELVDMMIEEADRVEKVVEGFLELTRPRAPRVEPTNASDILQRAARFCEAEALRNGVGIVVDEQADDCTIVCDPDHTYQIVLNLVLNAVQSLSEGDTVHLKPVIEPGRRGFAVADDGPGIPESIRENMFKPFVTTRDDGTGLGLAIVERLATAQGGTIRVDTSPAGTTFIVTFPGGDGR